MMPIKKYLIAVTVSLALVSCNDPVSPKDSPTADINAGKLDNHAGANTLITSDALSDSLISVLGFGPQVDDELFSSRVDLKKQGFSRSVTNTTYSDTTYGFKWDGSHWNLDHTGASGYWALDLVYSFEEDTTKPKYSKIDGAMTAFNYTEPINDTIDQGAIYYGGQARFDEKATDQGVVSKGSIAFRVNGAYKADVRLSITEVLGKSLADSTLKDVPSISFSKVPHTYSCTGTISGRSYSHTVKDTIWIHRELLK